MKQELSVLGNLLKVTVILVVCIRRGMSMRSATLGLLLLTSVVEANDCTVYINRQYVGDKSETRAIAQAFEDRGYPTVLYKDMSFKPGELHLMLGNFTESGGVFNKKCNFTATLIRLSAEMNSEVVLNTTVELKGGLGKCIKAMPDALRASLPVCQ